MSLGQLTGKQMDAYERVLNGVMLVSGTALLAALCGVYFFRSGGTEMLVCCIVAAVSVVALLIAAAELRKLERGFNRSDREARDDMHSALVDAVDD